MSGSGFLIPPKLCQSGEIGRHDGFKIRCLHGRAGSSPASGTIINSNSYAYILANTSCVATPSFDFTDSYTDS